MQRSSRSNINTRKEILQDGTEIDVVNLETINLQKLTSSSPEESLEEVRRLFSACQNPGMFYLDMRRGAYSDRSKFDTFPGIGEYVRAAFDISDQYFGQDQYLKLRDVVTDQLPSQDRGFKSCETDETYEISYDEVLGKRELKLPNILKEAQPVLCQFSNICHSAALDLLNHLSEYINTSIPTTPFSAHHQNSQFSDSGLKLVYEPCIPNKSQVIENKHTDSGTFTILFYEEWGLHVQLADGNTWGYAVAPLPEGCALVNVANSLERLSAGRFKSPVHRVTQPADGFKKRYYLSYFLRPSYNLKEKWEGEDESEISGGVRLSY